MGGYNEQAQPELWSLHSYSHVCVGQKNKINKKIIENNVPMINSLEEKMGVLSKNDELNAMSLVAIRGRDIYEQLWPQVYNSRF